MSSRQITHYNQQTRAAWEHKEQVGQATVSIVVRKCANDRWPDLINILFVLSLPVKVIFHNYRSHRFTGRSFWIAFVDVNL